VSRALFPILALCAAALAAAPPAVGRERGLQVGAAAPEFLIDTLDGISMTSDFHGKPAYINVFATWCPPCRRELPAIVQRAKQYRDRVVFLFVDEQEPSSRVKSFASTFGVTPVAVDLGQFGATFNVQGLPESIFIDRHGVVRSVYRGTIPDDVLAGELAALVSDSASLAITEPM
jgi:thiol-disulfide isomerase/thioredoxin